MNSALRFKCPPSQECREILGLSFAACYQTYDMANGKRLRLGVLASGKGSNLEALAVACRSGALNASLEIALSDVEDSGALRKAADFGLRGRFIPPGGFRTKLDEDAERVFVEALAALVRPGGALVITTINRTLASFALAKVALEYVLRTVPAGTHDPARFVKPAELRDEFAGAGIMLDDMTGFAPLPARRIGGNGFMRVGSLAVNYGASGTHA